MGVSKFRGLGTSEVENQRWGEGFSEMSGNIYVAWKTREQALAREERQV